MFKITTVFSVALIVGCGDVNAPIDKVEVNMPAPVVTPAPEVADDGIESATDVVDEAEPIVDKAKLEPIAEEAISEVIEEAKPEWPKVVRMMQVYDYDDKWWYPVEEYKCDGLLNFDLLLQEATIEYSGNCAGYEAEFLAKYRPFANQIKNISTIAFGIEAEITGYDSITQRTQYDPRISFAVRSQDFSGLYVFEPVVAQ